jgi:hypothetical protein
MSLWPLQCHIRLAPNINIHLNPADCLWYCGSNVAMLFLNIEGDPLSPLRSPVWPSLNYGIEQTWDILDEY